MAEAAIIREDRVELESGAADTGALNFDEHQRRQLDKERERVDYLSFATNAGTTYWSYGKLSGVLD
jgi:hypothetical protein